MGWLYLDKRDGHCECSDVAVTKSDMETWLPRKTQIGMIELVAPLMALEALGKRVDGCRIIVLVDSEAAEGALARGYSGVEDVCALAGLFWRQCVARGIAPYIDRVPTDGNPSDGPSRKKRQPLISRGAPWRPPPPVSSTLVKLSEELGGA